MIALANEFRVKEVDGEAPSTAREARALPGSPAESDEIFYGRRRLPHFERPWSKYAVAFVTRDRQLLSTEERDIVLNSILHGARQLQYELYGACVMPDHVHLLLEPQVSHQNENGCPVFWSLGKIL